MTIMTLSAFMRSKSPRAESDFPFVVSLFALLVIALLPPPALALSGPLCSPPTLIGAGERMLRAFLFACVYTVLVYSAAPLSNNLADTLVCIARSATASAWVLGANVFTLPLAALQVAIVLFFSFQHTSLQYDSVAGSSADVESASGTDHRKSPNGTRHETQGDHSIVQRGPPMAIPDAEGDIVATAAALTRKSPAFVQTLNGGGLSFNLALGAQPSLPSSCTTTVEKLRMAEIAASL